MEILDVPPARVLARVSGSEDYRTILTGKGSSFGGECSCPAFEQFGFCKHMVALAVALAGLILDLAERDDVLFRQLEMASVTTSDDDKTVVSRLRKAVTAATCDDALAEGTSASPRYYGKQITSFFSATGTPRSPERLMSSSRSADPTT